MSHVLMVQRIVNLEAEVAGLKRESACPCCTDVVIDGQPCTECRGTGKLAVAYDVVRIALKRERDERDEARAEVARLRDDAARLDWLTRMTTGEHTRVYIDEHGWMGLTREAIDEARTAQEPRR
jgi:hypothetical protein